MSSLPHSYRLLAIDDDTGVHETYRSLLSPNQEVETLVEEMENLTGENNKEKNRTCWQLDHAHSGKAGVKQVAQALQQQNPYALIYLDMRMPPGIDGVETAKAIRQIDPLVRIIFVSAYSDRTLSEIRAQIGVDFELLHKPVVEQEFIQLTRLHIQRWQQLTDLETQVLQRTRDLEKSNRKMAAVLESLTQEKGQTEQVLEVMREGVVMVDRRGNISYLNRKMEQLTGQHDLEVNGRPLHTLFLQQDSSSEGSMISPEALQRASRKLQQLLEQQQRLLRSWIDSALIGVLLVDTQGTIQISSPAMEGLSGWRSGELNGQPLQQLLPEEFHNKHAQHFADHPKQPSPRSMGGGRTLPLLHRSGRQHQVDIGLVPLQLDGEPLILTLLHDPAEQQQWELFKMTPFGKLFYGENDEAWHTWKLQQPDGSTIPLHVTGSPLYREDKEEMVFNGAVLLFHDAREIINQESRQQTQKAKEDFLATMSHELRTPLANIIGSGELLAESGLNGDQQQLLESMSHSSQGLLTLVNDILDYSKLESGSFRMEQHPLQLDELLSQLLQEFSPRMAEAGMSLQLTAPVPQQKIQGDPQRIRQILSNLLENARKYAARGTVILRATHQKTPQEALLISVEDQGEGISREDRERLFQPFEQNDGTLSRRHGGVGLGLYISRRLARLMGGELNVERGNKGVGSRFILQIPWVTAEDIPSPQPHAISTATQESKLLQGRVLVVEDAPEMQLLTRRMVERLGPAVDIASNGLEGVKMGLAQPYDLVLMDIQMPVMDGLEATAELRKAGYRGPIVAVTANVMPQHRSSFEQAGGNEFIKKPIDPQILQQVVERYLSHSSTDNSSNTKGITNKEDIATLQLIRKQLLIALLREEWAKADAVASQITSISSSFAGKQQLIQFASTLQEQYGNGDQESLPATIETLCRKIQQLTAAQQNRDNILSGSMDE